MKTYLTFPIFIQSAIFSLDLYLQSLFNIFSWSPIFRQHVQILRYWITSKQITTLEKQPHTFFIWKCSQQWTRYCNKALNISAISFPQTKCHFKLISKRSGSQAKSPGKIKLEWCDKLCVEKICLPNLFTLTKIFIQSSVKLEQAQVQFYFCQYLPAR